MSCGPVIPGVPHLGCCASQLAAIIVVGLRVIGGFPYVFGGAPAVPLQKTRYGQARVRADFPSTGAFWEMTGNLHRWTGGSITNDTSNMTLAEKNTLAVTGVNFPLRIDGITETVQYRLGGTGPFRNGTRVTTLEGAESLGTYVAELEQALNSLQTWPTVADARAFIDPNAPATFPVARYNIHQSGLDLYWYNVVGYRVGGAGNIDLVRLPAAMSRIVYGGAPLDGPSQVPASMTLVGQHFDTTRVMLMGLEMAKVRIGITSGDEWITRTKSWDETGFGYDQVLREEECNLAVPISGGIVAPPPTGDVEPHFVGAGYVYERRIFPGHTWPTPSGLHAPPQTVHPTCRPDLR